MSFLFVSAMIAQGYLIYRGYVYDQSRMYTTDVDV